MSAPLTRRTALKQLALAGIGLPLAGSLGRAAETAAGSPSPKAAFQLGVATVTLKSLPLADALAAVHRVGLDRVSLFRAHSPWENSPPAWQAVAQKIKAAGITVGCCGVLYLKNDEPAMRRLFDYAARWACRCSAAARNRPRCRCWSGW